LWDQLLYASVDKVRRQALQPVLHMFCLLVTQTVAGQTSWDGETSDNHLVQGRDCVEDAVKFATWTVRSPTSFLVLHISLPSVNNRHHFLTFTSFIAPLPYSSTIRLWISAGRSFLSFKNCIDRISQIPVSNLGLDIAVLRFSLFFSVCTGKFQLDHDRYLPLPYQFNIHSSSYIRRRIIRVMESVVNETINRCEYSTRTVCYSCCKHH
jgi:hypothetical protein